jgi:hypothetical protein
VYPPNADFPAGVDLNVADSIVRARYRNGFGKAELLKPGQPYEFTIEMYPTSLVFKRGHRICLDISSSNFPRFDINPNTGELLNNNRRLQVAENILYLDARHTSAIILPIIPSETTNLISELKLRKEQRQSSGSDACDSPDQIEVEPSLSQQRHPTTYKQPRRLFPSKAGHPRVWIVIASNCEPTPGNAIA